ncbi:MAG: hypothetical protein WC856_07600 [Methylococcaceae bacterium]|jgi:hypothetical protein
MCTHIEAIEKFISYFQEKKIDISSIQPIFCRKIIYAAALDTIARAAFGKTYTNHDRYIKLLNELTNWQYREHISLPQVCLAFEKEGISDNLYSEAKAQLVRWPHGQILSLDNSPLLSTLKPLADSEKSNRFLFKSQYAELFYIYRNNLIHEFREPGYGFEGLSTQNQPYYHGMTDMDTNNTTWELVFPVGFFEYLYNEALVGLKIHLVRDNINPFCQFELGSKWSAN